MLKVIINGCYGKMGKVLAQEIELDDSIQVVAGIDRKIQEIKTPFPVYDNIFNCKEKADVVIDFSRPEALEGLLDYAVNTNTPLVIATTGLSEQNIEHIIETSKKVPIFQSANMSLGINVLIKLVQTASEIIGDFADIEIVERHHNLKVDAPSGTAYLIADKINHTLNNTKKYTFGRHTKTERRKKDEIGIHAIRGGTIVGDHTVIFACSDEVIEISHSAASKNIFALGAIKAAKFIVDKKAGLYNMDDLIENFKYSF